MSMLSNSIIPDVAKFLCTGCGDIIPFIGDPLQQCTSCETSFRVSLSMMVGVACPAVRCPTGRGSNITVYSTDSNEEKQEWLTQLLCSLITLLQGYTDPQLETFTTGGKVDCVILTILRSLSREQLDELRPASETHRECTKDIVRARPQSPWVRKMINQFFQNLTQPIWKLTEWIMNSSWTCPIVTTLSVRWEDTPVTPDPLPVHLT